MRTVLLLAGGVAIGVLTTFAWFMWYFRDTFR